MFCDVRFPLIIPKLNIVHPDATVDDTRGEPSNYNEESRRCGCGWVMRLWMEVGIGVDGALKEVTWRDVA